MFTQEEKQKLVIKYKPLIKKISLQCWKKIFEKVPIDEIEGYANLGFSMAMNDYNEKRSKQTFAQYAAYRMKFSILDGLTECSQSVKLSYYYQQKLKLQGESSILMQSISPTDEERDDDRYYIKNSNIMYEETFGDCLDESPIDILVREVEENFDKIHTEVFLSLFGLGGRKEEKGKDVARRLGISPTLVTFKQKDVIRWIHTRKDLMETLQHLVA